MVVPVRKKFTNSEMYEMFSALAELSETSTGIFGYAVARNMRRLEGYAVDFARLRDDLIRKYGDEDNGTGTYSIPADSPVLSAFVKELEPIAKMENDVEIVKILPSDVPETFTGAQMYKIMWMIAEEAIPEPVKEN